ncbi:TPA: hypothetical protein EYP70_01105, partial [Candidatus Bathyarchaeota archaeon]|nr:hypothetical protein [Candidatus Bathyarchaeota archaeon]
MGSAIDIAKVSAKGSFALTLGMMISNLIMAVGTLIMASFLPGEEYGLYAVVLIPSAFFNLFQDLGINAATIKYTAQYRSERKLSETKKIMAFGLFFNVAIGAFLSLVSFLLSGYLAEVIFHRPQIKNLLEIMSINILLSALLRVSQSVFVGFERMEFYSITMILQSLLRGTLSPLLVVAGYGLFGAIMGVTLSSIASAILGLFFNLIFFYRRIEVAIESPIKDLGKYISFMLRYGLPVSASMIISGLQSQFFNFLMAIYCDDQMIANYQMAMNFTVLISFFVFPIITVLFPAFSKLSFEREGETLRKV